MNIKILLVTAPVPASVQTILGTMCKDIPGSYNDTTKWVYSRGNGKCEVIDQNYVESPDVRIANQFVFVFQVIVKPCTHFENNELTFFHYPTDAFAA